MVEQLAKALGSTYCSAIFFLKLDRVEIEDDI